MRRTVIVVPCYNEEARLPVAAFRCFAAAHPGIRFVMVDDGSLDGTADVLSRLVASNPRQFTSLRLDGNRGKAEAVRTGILHAIRTGCDHVGFIDADLASPLEELPRMIDVFERRQEISVVVGSRLRLSGHQVRRDACRRLLSRCFSLVAAGVLGLPLRDTQCGLKLFRSNAAYRLFASPFRSRWIFDVEVLGRLVVGEGRTAAASRIYECPLERWTEIPGSRVKLGDFAKAVTDLAGIFAGLVLHRRLDASGGISDAHDVFVSRRVSVGQ